MKGGPAHHVRELSLALQGRGISIIVIVPSGTFADAVERAGVRVQRCAIQSKWSFLSLPRLILLFARLRPTVIHCQDRRAGLLGRLIGRSLRVPALVYTLHGVPDSLASVVPGNLAVAPRRRRDVLYYKVMERWLSRLGRQVVITPSKALSEYATGFVGIEAGRQRIIPYGPSLGKPRSARTTSKAAPYAACWVGNMVPVKRVDLVLAALRRLPDLHLTLIGDGPLRPRLEQIAEETGIADRCRFMGHRVDVSAQLATHDIFVLPSGAENCPLALLEAMASGCAVVASAVGGVPEIIRHEVDGLLFEPGSATALVEELSKLREPGLRERLGAAARQRVEEQWSIDTCADNVVGVYALLTEGEAAKSDEVRGLR